MATPVQMPKQGNTVEECLIVEWLVQPGAAVAEGDILCTIETDKATFEVPAPVGGTLLTTFREAGELVPILTNIAVIGNEGEDVAAFAPDGSEAPAEAASTPEAASVADTAASTPAPAPVATGDGIRVSPRARALAAELGVPAAAVSGSGPHGRITSHDIRTAADAGLAMTPAAQAAASATGQVAGSGTGIGGRARARDLVAPNAAPATNAPTAPDEVQYIGIRKLIGDRMMQSLTDHAQLTMNASADASAFLAFRKKVKANAETLGLPNITLNDMIGFVVTQTLTHFPELNGTFVRDEGVFRMFRDIHLAFAVDTPRGLMVPVMRHADRMGLSQLSAEALALAESCKGGAIDPDLLQGGTFTITNLGALGIESFTPVLNTPQVAILGVCSIEQKAVPGKDGGVRWQPTMGLSLTIDHQVVDGGPAAKFLKAVANGIANFELMLAK